MIKPDNKKVSNQFLNYLKNTSTMSQSKPQPFKEKQPIIEKFHQHQTNHGPIEGDFSQIGLTYVLQNDKLKKKDAIYRKPGFVQVHNQKYDEMEQSSDVQLIKEITKLQFLQKKGYLKPEQTERLQTLRSMKIPSHFQEGTGIPEKRQIRKGQEEKMIPKQMTFEVDPQNIDPNMYYQPHQTSQNTKFGQPIYGNSHLNHTMHYNQQMNYPQNNQPMNYPQKPQYFDQGHPINYGPSMHSQQFDHRQTGYY